MWTARRRKRYTDVMFRKLREALDAALSALESRSGDPREDITNLLAAMREELIEAKARLPELEENLNALRASREREFQSAEDCARRARQALAIDDQETVEVALRHEARHRTRVDLYDRKIEAAEAELAVQRQTVTDMTAQLKESLAQRESLEVRARRARSTEQLRGSRHSSADRFDRLAEEIEQEDDLLRAQREVEEELGSPGGRDARREEAIDPEQLAEWQLRELKRRMADEGGREGG